MTTMTHKKSMRLKPFKREHVQLYYEWNSSSEILGPYVEPDHRLLEELLDDFDIDEWCTNRMRCWLVVDEDNEIMGYAHCWEFDPFETHIEFGRVLLPEFRQKGLGAEFLHLVIDKVFEETEAHRIQSVTSCENTPVQKNWAKLGLRPESRLRDYMKLDNKYVDCYLLSLLRPEWEESHEKSNCPLHIDLEADSLTEARTTLITKVDQKIEDAFISDNFSHRRKLIAEIFEQSPMFNVSLKRVFNRQLEDTNGHKLYDFATQDYLGFDFEPAIVEAAVKGTRDYGTVVAWCRMVATVDLFNEVEEKIAELIGTEACSIFASTTLLNHGVIPALLGKDGVLFLEKTGHATMYEGAKIARDSGAKLTSFLPDDLEGLEALLKEHSEIPKKLIAIDGVNSMTGDYPDLIGLDKLAKKYDALIFVDDAHGFGVVGESPSDEHPYGRRGNGIVRHFGLDYSNILYIGCFSKAYGSFGSFIGCSKKMREFFLSQATPHDLGGMGPASAMSAVLAGLELNAIDGDRRRKYIHFLVERMLKGLTDLGFTTHNKTGFPIISVRLKAADLMVDASKLLYEHKVMGTLAPYPSVKKGDEAFRLTVTASNTEEEIDTLIFAFAELKKFIQDKGFEI